MTIERRRCDSFVTPRRGQAARQQAIHSRDRGRRASSIPEIRIAGATVRPDRGIQPLGKGDRGGVIALLIVGSNGMIAVLSPYAAEIVAEARDVDETGDDAQAAPRRLVMGR